MGVLASFLFFFFLFFFPCTETAAVIATLIYINIYIYMFGYAVVGRFWVLGFSSFCGLLVGRALGGIPVNLFTEILADRQIENMKRPPGSLSRLCLGCLLLWFLGVG